MAMTRLPRAVGFNVVGYLSGNLGLGVAARHVASLILSRGFPLAVFDLTAAERSGHDTTFRDYAVPSLDALPHAVTLVVLPPQTIADLSGEHHPAFHRLLCRREGIVAAVLMWEHTQVPRAWRPALGMLDAIVTVSHFIRSACDTTLDGVLTIPADFPLHLPTVGPLRERFQLPSDRSIFVTSFEAYGAERKNPLATVEAFRRAFPDGHQALLVIRINNASDGVPHPVVVRLREQCANDRRFRLIENALSYRDVLTLYASCDVLISLHRSEGLGLALMEAMALGKPVIATAWSGNMTYMTTMNSCLVTYRLVPVKTTLDVYAEQVLGRHALWAEPDVDDAAAWMARLATDGSLRSRIGARAAESMARREAKAELGTFLDELVAIHDQYAFLPSFQSKKARLVAVEPQFLANDKRRGLRSYVGRTLQRHILRRVADWSQRE